MIYNPNGGFGGAADFDLPAGSTYTIGSAAQAGVTRPGYTFVAWDTEPGGSGTLYLPGDTLTITGNVTLYAQWEIEPPNTITVVYDPNGGTGGLIDPGIAVGSSYTIKSAADANISRPGYAFTGWNTEADGSGITYQPGEIITAAFDTTLYAQWEQVAYTVTYHKNPLPGFGDDATYTTPLIPFSTPETFPPAAVLGFFLPTLTFVEWNTDPGGYGLSFPAGTSYAFNENVDLYAIWKRDR